MLKSGCKGLCLETLFCVVGVEHLFDEGAVAFTDIDSGVAFVTDDRRPSNMFGIQSNRFARGDSADYAQRVQR